MALGKRLSVVYDKVYEDFVYQVGSFEGNPITETLTVAEQKEIEKVEGLTVEDVIRQNIVAYRDWQTDC